MVVKAKTKLHLASTTLNWNFNRHRVNFINVFTCSFYVRRSRKRKKQCYLTVFLALLGFVRVKAARKHVDEILTGTVELRSCRETKRRGFCIPFLFPFCKVCHGFRLTKRDDYFRVNFDHFWINHHFIRQLGQYWKSAWA